MRMRLAEHEAAVAGRRRIHHDVDRERNDLERPFVVRAFLAAQQIERNGQAVIDFHLVADGEVEFVEDDRLGDVRRRAPDGPCRPAPDADPSLRRPAEIPPPRRARRSESGRSRTPRRGRCRRRSPHPARVSRIHCCDFSKPENTRFQYGSSVLLLSIAAPMAGTWDEPMPAMILATVSTSVLLRIWISIWLSPSASRLRRCCRPRR